jgi:hypothetical protein
LSEQSLALLGLLRRARRRFTWQIVFHQAALAAAVALALFVLLLLLGTQVLDWYWLFALVFGALGIAVLQTWRGVPSLYGLAQVLDNRLGLHDALSTAHHFLDRPARSAQVRDAQLKAAAALLPEVDIRAALPRQRPRSLYAVGGLTMLACGLFALRYGVMQSLDLRPSLLRMALDRVLPEETAVAAAKAPPGLKKRLEQQLEKLGINVNGNEGDPTRNETADDNSSELSADSSKDGAKVQTASIDPNNPAERGDASPEGEKGAAAGDKSGPEQADSDQPAAGQQPSDQNAGKKGNQRGDQNPSLMDRMRDAMAGLMNKLKSQRGSETQQASSKASQDGRQSSQGQKGSPMPGKPQGNSDSQGDQEGQQQEGQGDKNQTAQGKSGDKSASQQSPESKSGIGKEDGDKSAREAEQLAAMGKISEIIGKRSQNLAGEIMIEVRSNRDQQLKTAYTGRQGQHAEAGGEISRDEVPLIYQQYVQQYFEQVRKMSNQPSKQKGGRANN